MLQEFTEQIGRTIEEFLSGVHTAMPGEIKSFDSATCTAVVLPKGQFRSPDGRVFNYPVISGVPVVLIQGGGQDATIAFPIKEGDGCLLIICEQALDYWRYGGETQAELRHDLTNAVAIPGLFAKPNAAVKEAIDNDAIVIKKGDSKITLSQSGIAIRGDLTVEGNITTTTGKITASQGLSVLSGDVTAGNISLKNHTHTSSEPGSQTSAPQ
ncbi:Gp138 family membrane-puncturing spike protein [Calorimonas adulescens]|uniref:Phage protein Gp138 N-terminal domain-containing protein n=1 Tax=Calorimonas adulescens TaxID=2606906 RepID=A0A5D8QGA4_9THEO|nr:Gp138 family membrane-puncturing spike protein [Calorimonas adulescens]TZE83531.1 hypothetical protein FWJ32_01220 [Calorimonas adulescens]